VNNVKTSSINIILLKMWKPWILIALGSAVFAGAAARGFPPE
jgi:hypothetical protein